MTCVLFSGSFNPVHFGHLSIAKYIADLPETNSVRIIPSPRNPLKDKSVLSSPKQRLQEVRTAFEGLSPKISVSDVEYRLPQPSYTFDTLSYLQETEPDTRFVLAIGADNLVIFDKWYRYQDILRMCELWVYPRPGYELDPEKLSEICGRLSPGSIRYLKEAPIFDISSSMIRNNSCMKKYNFEICANSVESCIAAQEGGADRVELCAGIPEGGTTPSYGDIVMARNVLKSTRLHVIIRPRGGDFLYSELELGIMLEDIAACRKAGADGVVFGCLTSEGDIDIPAMKRLMEASEGLSVTFHRAFDVCRAPEQALEDIIALGCDRLLTSGAQTNAEAGIPLIREMVTQAAGRIRIMAGCGVNENNIARIARETGASDFHFSARENIPSVMQFRRDTVSMGGTVHIDEYSRMVTTAQRVAATIAATKG